MTIHGMMGLEITLPEGEPATKLRGRVLSILHQECGTVIALPAATSNQELYLLTLGAEFPGVLALEERWFNKSGYSVVLHTPILAEAAGRELVERIAKQVEGGSDAALTAPISDGLPF
jgi:hypothetical protein